MLSFRLAVQVPRSVVKESAYSGVVNSHSPVATVAVTAAQMRAPVVRLVAKQVFAQKRVSQTEWVALRIKNAVPACARRVPASRSILPVEHLAPLASRALSAALCFAWTGSALGRAVSVRKKATYVFLKGNAARKRA